MIFLALLASFSRVSGTGMREGTDTLGHPGMLKLFNELFYSVIFQFINLSKIEKLKK